MKRFSVYAILLTASILLSCEGIREKSHLAETDTIIENPVTSIQDVLNASYRLKNPKWYQQDLADRLKKSESEVDQLMRAEIGLRAAVGHTISSGGLGEELQNSAGSASGTTNLQVRILGFNMSLATTFTSEDLKNLDSSLTKRQQEFAGTLAAWLGVSSVDEQTFNAFAAVNRPALVKLLQIRALGGKITSDLDQLVGILTQRALEKCSKAVDLPAVCPVLPANKPVYDEYRQRYLDSTALREKMGSTPDRTVGWLAVNFFKTPYDREGLVLAIKSLAVQIKFAPLWKDILEGQLAFLDSQAYDVEKYSTQKNIAQFLSRTTSDADIPKLLDLSVQNAERELGLATELIESRNRKITETVSNLLACAESDYLQSDLDFLKNQKTLQQGVDDRQKQISGQTLVLSDSKAGAAKKRVEAEKLRIETDENDRARQIEELRKEKVDIENQWKARDTDLKKNEENLKREQAENNRKLDDFKKLIDTYLGQADAYPEAHSRLTKIKESLAASEREAKERSDWAMGPMNTLIEKVKTLTITSKETDFQALWDLAFNKDNFCEKIRLGSKTPSSVLDFCDGIEQLVVLGRMNVRLKQDSSTSGVKAACQLTNVDGKKNLQVAACNIQQNLEQDSVLLAQAKAAADADFKGNSVAVLKATCAIKPQSILTSIVCTSLERIEFYDAIKGYKANPKVIDCSAPQKNALSAEFCSLQDLYDRTIYWKGQLQAALADDGTIKKDTKICSDKSKERIPHIDELCQFTTETTQGVTLGPEFALLQNLPELLKGIGPFEKPISWNDVYTANSLSELQRLLSQQLAFDVREVCFSWFQSIDVSKYAQQMASSSYYKQAYEALLANAEIKCQAAEYWLAVNIGGGPNTTAYLIVSQGKATGISVFDVKSPEAQSMRAEINARGSYASSYDKSRPEVKKAVADRLRDVSSKLQNVLDLTENGGFATKTQMVERIRSIGTEIERNRFDLERTIDTTISKAEELRTQAETELLGSLSEAEERITRKSPQEIDLLKAEIEDGIFGQKNQLLFIQAQFRQTEADRLDGITVEMNKFLLDNEIARIRTENDAALVAIAQKSLLTQVGLAEDSRTQLTEWHANQKAYLARLEELISKGGALKIALGQLNLQGAVAEQEQAQIEVKQAQLEVAVRKLQADVQSSEATRQIRNAEIRLAAYKKACEMKVDTGLSDQDLQLVTDQILAKSNVQIDLSLRNLQILSELANDRVKDVAALRLDLKTIQTRKDKDSPMAQSQRLRILMSNLQGLRTEIQSKIYSSFSIRKDKLEIPLYPALSQTEADATSATADDKSKPRNHLARFYTTQYLQWQAKFAPAAGETPAAIGDPFEDTDKGVSYSVQKISDASPLTVSGLEQCFFDTFASKGKAIEDATGLAAQKAEASAPKRQPEDDDIRQQTPVWLRWYGSRARAMQNVSSQLTQLQDIKRLWVASKFIHLFKLSQDFNQQLNAPSEDDIVGSDSKLKLGIDASSLAEYSFVQGIRLKPFVVVEGDNDVSELAYEVSCAAASEIGTRAHTVVNKSCATTGNLTSGHPVTAIKSTAGGGFATWRPQDLWPEREVGPDQSLALYTAHELQGAKPLLDNFQIQLKKLTAKSALDPHIRGVALRMELLSFPSADRSQIQFDWNKHLIPKRVEGDLNLSNIYLPWEAQVFANNQGVLGWLLGEGPGAPVVPASCQALR